MKLNLRHHLPPSAGQLWGFEELVATHQDDVPDIEAFHRFMVGVHQAGSLSRYRTDQEHPASLGALVDTVCASLRINREEVARRIKTGVVTWKKVLASRCGPEKIAITTYVRFAREYGIGYQTLKHAITGSHDLFRRIEFDPHIRFARSTRLSRSREGYSEHLGAAFAELRTKVSQRRDARQVDPVLSQLLAGLEQCLT